MKRLKLLTLFVSLFICVGLFFGTAPKASASLFQSSRDAACTGSQLQDPSLGGITQQLNGNACDSKAASNKVNDLVSTALNLLSLVVGIASVIMIIIGGLKFVTSQGEGANVAGARNTILYAIVGLVITAIAQVIVRLVLSRATR